MSQAVERTAGRGWWSSGPFPDLMRPAGCPICESISRDFVCANCINTQEVPRGLEQRQQLKQCLQQAEQLRCQKEDLLQRLEQQLAARVCISGRQWSMLCFPPSSQHSAARMVPPAGGCKAAAGLCMEKKARAPGGTKQGTQSQACAGTRQVCLHIPAMTFLTTLRFTHHTPIIAQSNVLADLAHQAHCMHGAIDASTIAFPPPKHMPFCACTPCRVASSSPQQLSSSLPAFKQPQSTAARCWISWCRRRQPRAAMCLALSCPTSCASRPSHSAMSRPCWSVSNACGCDSSQRSSRCA